MIICYSLVMQMLCFSLTQFFTRFFIGLSRICSHANVHDFDYRHLFASLARVDCVADKSKLMNESYIFSMKDPLVCTHFCPQNTGERILGL